MLPRYLKRVIHAADAGEGGNAEMLLLEGVGQLLNLRSYRYADAVEEAAINLANIRASMGAEAVNSRQGSP